MKILVSKLRALGDTVLLSSTVALLKKQYPEAAITVLVPAAFRDVFYCNPQVQELWCYEDQSYFSLLWKVRKKKFDATFHFHSSDRMLWLSRFSGAFHNYIQFHNELEQRFVGKDTNALQWAPRFLKREVKQWREDISVLPAPRIFLTEQEKDWGKNFWQKRGADPKKVVFLGLGASRPTKIWPLEHFARFGELLRDRLEFIPAIIFGPGEEEAKNAAVLLGHLRVKGFRPQNGIHDNGGVIFQSGLSVRELASVLSACRAYVGNDSGPKHLSAAVGIPTFTFFGPEDPNEWHPYPQTEHPLFFIPELKCRMEDGGRWCSIQNCINEKHKCMTKIDPLDVLEKFREVVQV